MSGTYADAKKENDKVFAIKEIIWNEAELLRNCLNLNCIKIFQTYCTQSL